MTEFNTDLIHGAKVNDNQTGAINPPIYNSSTYAFPSLDTFPKWDYERSGNPTREALENQIATLEHGAHGLAFASGVAAIHATLAIFKPGDHIIVSKHLYGGTIRLFNDYFVPLGLTITTVDIQNIAAIEKAVTPNTKAIYFETIDNPLLHVASVKQIAKIAQAHTLLTIVDNTFLTPYLQQPLDLGADIVIHSATKYLSGHGDVLAGLVVAKDEEIGKQIAFIQNAIGGVLSPEDANLVRRGIQTLAVRLDRIQDNARLLLATLQASKQVVKIHYPGLAGDRSDQVYQEEIQGGGGVISVEFADSVDLVKALGKLKYFKLATSLGAVESLIEVPFTMSHTEVPESKRLEDGITPSLVRIAVGIEDGHDLVNDLQQAFDL